MYLASPSPWTKLLSEFHPKCKVLNIGVARVFDWEGGKPQTTCNDVIRNFRKRNFLWDNDIAECKISSPGLVSHLTKILLEGESLNPKRKCLN